MDPFHALATVFLGVYKERKVQRWCVLLFTMGFSGLNTFLFVTGTALTTSRSWPISIGSGMISSAVIMTVLFRRSDLTKGMTVALPEDEARKEVNTDVQIIQH